MEEQNTQTQDPQEQEEQEEEQKELCAKAGRLAGDVARRLYIIKKQVEKQLIKLSKSTYQVTQSAVKKGKKTLKDSTIICRGLERKWELWRGEQKRQVFFTQLGAEVARLHKEETPDLLHQSKIKSLLKQIRDIEQHLEETKKAGRSKKATTTKTTAATTKKPRKRTRPKKENPPPLPEGETGPAPASEPA